MIEHHIQTDDTEPIILPLPQIFQVMVKQELNDMLNWEIIEPSARKWAVPIVSIIKRDGSHRL